ncbi:MAG TPA: tryptophan synthase subunit alpha [Candidatus Methylomirabilis sp.]|nr:tryptophan synthase subunit alpha [Candidatus Methylomirabilis sp.]HSC69925.1 tryptophan synthase subunit alpha [Candidatus Methylomirabilis sp.]
MSENRIDRAFARLRETSRKGLIPFLAAGDPSLELTEALIREFEERGADVVEIGVPFSDPLADGVVNQRAYQRALAQGASLGRILDLVARVRRHSEIPLVLMSYVNPIHRYGLRQFPAAAREAGVDGLILSDCPPEEMNGFLEVMGQAGIHPILLVAPTSPDRRISLISARGRGYIYYVSLRGVTGQRDHLPEDLAAGILRVRRLTDRPLAVGFGISTPAQAASAAALADAVIVGSAIVARIEAESGHREQVARVGEFVKDLRSAVG